ncbi:MAG: hypothetical protein ACI9XO_000762 [Paraglaciecola sp.]|jgi:hypothetical protein
MKNLLFFAICLLILSCQNSVSQPQATTKASKNNALNVSIVEAAPVLNFNPEGKIVSERFPVPVDFERTTVTENSFGYYLRHLPLKPDGTKVKHYDGSLKWSQLPVAAVIDIDVENRDLQQCADAIMRLRAEYLRGQNRPDDIHFNFVSGFNAEYKKWRQGYRIKVKGNKVTWRKEAQPSDDYKSFRRYMTMVFSYAGTLSLAKELEPVAKNDLQIGDVFIRGGSPGHAVVVVDVCENKVSKEKRFLLAQSYMPAQDMHVLTNPNDTASAWYSNDYEGTLETVEWTFQSSDLKRF